MTFASTKTVLFASACALSATTAMSNEVVERLSTDTAASATVALAEAAVRPGRILSDPAQLSPRTRALNVLPNRLLEGVEPEAYGTGNHPYTTARAAAVGTSTPVELAHLDGTGKLFMSFGTQTFVCSASVINRNLLVTAAHCVHNFGAGDAGFADSVSFQPAMDGTVAPYGEWNARSWFIPRVYHDGTDVCSAGAPGIVCENDIAVVVLEPNSVGEPVGETVSRYNVNEAFDNFGLTEFLGQTAGQITQLGYPAADFSGDEMLRADSLAYTDAPMNLVWGSNMTGGSSGGPILHNFGTASSFSGVDPIDGDLNVVTSVTSWGFRLGGVKVQGGSRFAKNTTFTDQSNIAALIEAACSGHADACD